jgi:outer membrane protein OmpA-like peptidoglycan-associated protein
MFQADARAGLRRQEWRLQPTRRSPAMKTIPTPASRIHRALVVLLGGSAIVLAGCANMSERERGTATGAGIGAVAGAVLSSATGGRAGTGAVVGGVVGAVAGNLWSKRMEDKRVAMERATQGTGIDVERTASNELRVNVPADFSFDVGRSAIKSDMRPVLDQFAQGLDPNMRVRIVGHTDSTGSDAINNPLSVDRAASVRDYLAARGVTSTRVQVEGRGAREPVADNASDAGRAQNRRVEIFLRDPQA